VTNDAVKRLAKLRQRERICGRSIKNQISIAIRLEDIPDQLSNTTRPFVIAVGIGCALIGLFQRCQHFGANCRRVVACKLMALTAPMHIDLANRVHHAQQMPMPQKEKLPDGPEPRACRARQTNHFNCSLNLIRFGAAFHTSLRSSPSRRPYPDEFFWPLLNSFAFTSQ